jgi:aminocarboxymuconate-semialdehyde decarboxylase
MVTPLLADDTRIDFHTHILHSELMTLAEDKVVLTGFGARPPQERPPGSRRAKNYGLQLEPELHVAEMDRRGIDVHVLSSSTVVQGTFWASASEEAKLCRLMNDAMAGWVNAYPQRFIGSVILPFQDVAASLAELERCRAEHDFTIVNAPAAVNGVYLGEPRFNDYWSFVDRHKLITFIHPDGVRDPWFQKFSLWNSVGQPLEEVKVIACLIYEGILDRFPDARIVVTHGGGYAPLYMGRLDRNVTNMPTSASNIKGLPSDYLRRFYFDTCVYDPIALHRLIDTVGADRLVLGSDFPVGDVNPFVLIDQLEDLASNDRNAIVGRNAAQMLSRSR